jgi:hypothetical protein
MIDLSQGLTPYSPDFYSPVGGGDVAPISETVLSFPQCDASLGCGDGVVTQDGTTGDTSDPSSLWSNIFGAAGSFLRGFTGGSALHLAGGSNPAVQTKLCSNGQRVPVGQNCPGQLSSTAWIFIGLAGLVILVLALRR